MERAYSVLRVKSFDDARRVIKGIATTPSTDSHGDVIESLGISFSNPVPLLWQHDMKKPVGLVKFDAPTAEGVTFTAELADVAEPGTLKDRIDEAWQSLKAGLVRGVSIGFKAQEYAWMDDGGIHFLKTIIHELSLVTIPSNADATITAIKSIDAGVLAALGHGHSGLVRKRPVASGKKSAAIRAVKVKSSEKHMKKTIAEQIADFKATRAAKALDMEGIMTKAAEDGATLDAEESENYDTCAAEVAAIDKHLDRLQTLQKAQTSTARPVADDPRANAGAMEFKEIQVRARNTQKLDAGIAFARAAKCLALGHLEHRDAIQIAERAFEGHPEIIAATRQLVTKAAVAPATTTHATWAAPLVGTQTDVFADFVEFLRPQTILGQFGVGAIPALRRVPFRTRLLGQTSGGDGYWVGEGQPKPVTKFDFSGSILEPLKVANIAVATMELIRDSSPSADVLLRDQLASALRERLDRDFIDPTKAAAAGVSPGSIINGITAIASSGTDADHVRTDIKAIFAAFIAANNAPTSGVWIMSAVTALALSQMTNPLGQSEFPGITMTGGALAGIPVIVSQYVPLSGAAPQGGTVILVNASDIYLGDEGGIDLSMSTEASLQMDNAPDSPATAATVMVSLWQQNLVGFRAERAINWSRRRVSAAAWLSGVKWGAGA